MDAAARFAALVDELAQHPDVVPPQGSRTAFGASTLKVGRSIFAMLCGDELVVKLPAARVQALQSDGTGGPFASSRGTPMREWTTVRSTDPAVWRALSLEALDFVRR